MNESPADILLAWSIYFAMFENNNATFYGNQLCAVDDDLLLLPVLSVILKCGITVFYTRSFSISNIQNIPCLCFIGVECRKSQNLTHIDMAAKTGNN